MYSERINQFYVGHSKNVVDRIESHNNSGSKSTKKTNDWKLVYSEKFSTRSEAMKREIEIKRKKSRRYIEWLITK